MRNQFLTTLPSRIFPLCHGLKRTHVVTMICDSRVCMLVIETSSMPQNCMYCHKLHRFSCFLTAISKPSSCENKMSQTAQALGSHIYFTNVEIPRLWYGIFRFFTHFLDKKHIAHETLKMQGLFILWAPLMRNR